jgi:uncharacterized protein YggT (Ycf19 family)
MIRFIINFYIIILIADAVLVYFPQIKRNNIVLWIRKLSEYTIKPVRRLIPQDLGFDFSWLVVIIILKLIMLLW